MTVAVTWRELSAEGLRREAVCCRDVAAARRMLALALVLEGSSREAAARATGMDRQTLRDWVHRHNQEGIAGLRDRPRSGRKPRLTPAQTEELAAVVEQGPEPERADGKPIEIWFQDEARVGQQGTLTRVWARRGTRPRAPRDQRYAWAYLFGAIGPERAIGAGLVLPYVNTDAMHLHLQEISRHVAPGAHAVLVLDGAGWHSAAALVVPANLTLLPLPPKSPELNPVENVWEYLRQNQLSLRMLLRSGRAAMT